MATSLRVLIVEDNPIDAELMLRELRRDGFEPVWRRVESADDFAGALSPELDVVLSDYSLPHFDALAALRVVEDSQLGLPFIVVSGAISEEVAVDCMKRGAADYILKDRLARLGQAVRHAMEAKKARDEQRRAEAALREHEASFRLLAERAHDVIFRYRLQPTPGLDFVSPAVSRTTGYSPEELYADPGLCSRIVLPEDRPTFHSLVLSGDSPQPVTLRIRHRNGHIVWLELTAVALRDDSGEPLGAEGIARDVTERMQAEEAVRTSEARFRAVFAQAAIGMALTDPRGRFLDTNPAFQAMLGYSGAELAGMLVDDITHPEDTVRESQLVRTVLTGQADHCQMEKRYIRKSGDVMRARLTVSMVRGKSPGEDLAIGLVEDITEWRLAETALKESQSLLASIYDTVPVGICVADEAGRFLEVNAAFSEIYGCPRVGLIGQHISRVLPGVPNGRLEAAFARLLCGNSNLLTEAQMRRHDGEVVDVAEASAMVVREDGHRVLITAVSDISDRKRTESALHETEERFRALFDRSLDGVYVHDFVGNFLDANDAALQMLGYAREDVSRLNFAALVAADQKPLLAQTMEELIETGTQREATVFRLRRADGVEVWVETKSSVIFHGDEPYAIQGIARDITERKLSETALRESEARFRAVFDNAAIGIAISDLEERVVEANPAHLRLMGYSVEELRGLRTADRVHAEDLPRTVDLLRGLVSGDHKHNQQQRRNIRKDGRPVWVNIIHSVIRDAEEKPRYVLGMVEDITTRREMEEQLQRAQRLEIAGRVAAQVAHDFNNLLVPVAGLPELIKMRLPQGDPAAAMCDVVLEAARSMAAINENMLALGRRGHIQRQATDMNAVVEQAVANMPGAPATLAVRLDLAPGLPPVDGAQAQLLRVVANLVANARDATEDIGVISIETVACHLDGRRLGRYARIEVGEYVKLTVNDTGSGIAEDVRDKIFDAFFTTKRADDRRGSGLGLTVVQSIVDDHNGYIDLETVAGRGTSFDVYLPVSRGQIEKGSGGGLPGGSEGILVVDDDRFQRLVATQMLQMLGYRVVTVTSGEEAVAYLREHRADLVLLDMVMPGGMDGVETYRRILEVRPGQKAIIVSGCAETELVQQAQLLGAGAFYQKPLTVDKLAQAVRTELARAA